ncbi:MAG: amidohydrolase [Acidobacteriia bacterium]|jgi:hippurate hydrolase|nr:amidohydrolase [Terriglobia bacterium]
MPYASRFVRFAVRSLGLLATLAAPVPAQEDLDALITRELAALRASYEHLHRHPELSYQEKQTAAYLAGELRRLGFEVTENVGDYGVAGRTSYGLVAVLRNGAGPTVLLRTDLDALPVEEKTGLPYASRVRALLDGSEVPVMHACGHDMHMTAWLGAARLLVRLRERWQGTLVLIGQPAEERGAGARAMLRDGLYTRFPRPDAVVALHVSPDIPAGKIGYREGYALASADSVDITVYGAGGHGAYPHRTKDPIVIASQLVLALQTIVSREIAPLEPAVVTVGSFHAGTKHNIIPDQAHLQLTVRAYKPEVREHILEAIRRIARGVALAAGLPEDRLPRVVHSEEEATPSTYNDPALTERLAGALKQALDEANVVRTEPVMGAEDFSRYGLEEPRVPICMLWLGAADLRRLEAARAAGTTLPGLHSAEFAPVVEPAIQTGVKALTTAALELFKK